MGYVIPVGIAEVIGDSAPPVKTPWGWVELRRKSVVIGVNDDPAYRESRTIEVPLEAVADYIAVLRQVRRLGE